MECLRLAAWVLASAAAAALPLPVPASAHVALLLKVLTADRNLPARGSAGLAIGIVYQETVPASREAAKQIVQEIEMENRSRREGPVRYGLVDVSDPSALVPVVAELRPDVLYVAPLEAFDVTRISAVSRAGKIRTATGVPAFVDEGVAVGFEAVPQGVRILINVEAARAEGADFSSKVLKLARRVP